MQLNFNLILQLLAHENHLHDMFEHPMVWCRKNIDRLGLYIFKQNQFQCFVSILKLM